MENIEIFKDQLENIEDSIIEKSRVSTVMEKVIFLAEAYARYQFEKFISDHFPENALNYNEQEL